jgi:hypothetical protein
MLVEGQMPVEEAFHDKGKAIPQIRWRLEGRKPMLGDAWLGNLLTWKADVAS